MRMSSLRMRLWTHAAWICLAAVTAPFLSGCMGNMADVLARHEAEREAFEFRENHAYILDYEDYH